MYIIVINLKQIKSYYQSLGPEEANGAGRRGDVDIGDGVGGVGWGVGWDDIVSGVGGGVGGTVGWDDMTGVE